jgi:hypothetical protein
MAQSAQYRKADYTQRALERYLRHGAEGVTTRLVLCVPCSSVACCVFRGARKLWRTGGGKRWTPTVGRSGL